jgi:hypothetical protein
MNRGTDSSWGQEEEAAEAEEGDKEKYHKTCSPIRAYRTDIYLYVCIFLHACMSTVSI